MTRTRPAVVALACALGFGLVEGVAQIGALALWRARAVPSEPTYSFRLTDQQRAQLELIVTGASKYVAFDADLGWSIVPNGAGGLYKANSRGLRSSREYTDAPGPGVFRVATYGDSFVHGDDVANDDAWQAQIERLHPGVEMLNFGVGGFGTDQAYLRYRRDGRAGAPVVVIGVMTENIARLVSRFRPYYFPRSSLPLAKPRFRLTRTGTLEVVRPPFAAAGEYRRLLDLDAPAFRALGVGDDYYERGFRSSPFDLLATVRLTRMLAYEMSAGARELQRVRTAAYDPGSEAFDLLVAILTAFARDVHDDGATPMVVVFPRRRDIDGALAGHPKVHQPLLEALQRERLRWLDLTDDVAREAAATGPDALIRVHFTPAGNRLAADAIYAAADAARTEGTPTPR